MSYVDNASLVTAWDNRVQALKDKIATLYDGTSHNVLIEDISEANVLLSPMSVDSLTLDSNEQAPQITIETPTLILNPEEGSEEETPEEGPDESDQEEEKVDTVDETVEETSEETEEDETKEENHE